MIRFAKALVASAILSVLTSVNAFAEGPQRFVDEANDLIDRLHATDILPNKVVNQLSNVDIVISSEFDKPLNATRRTAFADPVNGRVFLNSSANYSGDLTTLILHEALSAIGWRDTNYENSIVISILLRDAKTPVLSDSMREEYKAKLERVPFAKPIDYRIGDARKIDLDNSILTGKGCEGGCGGGGVVLVGGGGDLKAAQIKELLLWKFLSATSMNPSFRKASLRNLAEGAKIESIITESQRQTLVRVISIYNSKRRVYERVFLVPSNTPIEVAVKDIWYFMVFIGEQGNLDAKYDFLIPRTSSQKDAFRRYGIGGYSRPESITR